MTSASVHIGSTYAARVSGKPVTVRIERPSPYGGWDALNLRAIRSGSGTTSRRQRPLLLRQLRRPSGAGIAYPTRWVTARYTA